MEVSERLKWLAADVERGGNFEEFIREARSEGHHINIHTAKSRFAKGMDLAKIITTPTRPKRKITFITFTGGRRISIKKAAKEFGIPYQTIATRVRKHPDWPAEKIINSEYHKRGRRFKNEEVCSD